MTKLMLKLIVILSIITTLFGCSKEAETEKFFCYGTSFTHKNNILRDVKEEKRLYSVSKDGISEYKCDFSERTILCRSEAKTVDGPTTKELIVNRKYRFVVEIDTLTPGGSPNYIPSQVIYEAKCDKAFF